MASKAKQKRNAAAKTAPMTPKPANKDKSRWRDRKPWSPNPPSTSAPGTPRKPR